VAPQAGNAQLRVGTRLPGDSRLALIAAEHALRIDSEVIQAQAVLIGLAGSPSATQFADAAHGIAAEARKQLAAHAGPNNG
jgi:hypothetical protein